MGLAIEFSLVGSAGLRCVYLEQAVHVGLHVGDGHPLHDDVRDAALQGLPFYPGHSGGVQACHAPVRRPEHRECSVSKGNSVS